ncbi:MAG: histidine triad nucleotide-binding protein [Deltaproteobacteria bacterium]|nr:MAG: histidine triad nucleotide-binding protein [Deltaproteobacteria bacterium]
MEDCLFCKIGRGELAAEKVFDDGELFAIRDINPMAPLHVLVIPHRHIETVLDLGEADDALAGRALRVACEIARREGVADGGFRIVANCNRDGGQTVFHLHFHVLGGRAMKWPPG